MRTTTTLGAAVTLIALAAACSSTRKGTEDSGMGGEPEAQVGQQITLEGTAQNAKGGAVVVEAGSGPTYVVGLESWPDALVGQPVEVVGTLNRRKLIPFPVVGDDGAVSAGAQGEQRVLEGAPAWKKSLGGFTVVSGTARNAGAGPVIVTPIGPVYLHEVGEQWPEASVGKAVTAVGKLLRKKRPSTPENDDSEFGGKPELTEEWAFTDASWVVE